MVVKPTQETAYELLHRGAIALSDISSNGVRVDTEYCERAFTELTGEIEDLEDELHALPEMKEWRRVKGRKLDLGTNDQVAELLYDRMGLDPARKTGLAQKRAVDADSLMQLDVEWIPRLIRWRRLGKARDTYLSSILREAVDGYLHPLFKLHTVPTFRSSCSNPNFQNMPIRNPEIGRIIRSAIIPRPGRQILELDYSGAEVRVAACYHKDPGMIRYILDPSKDMHRDSAGDCYVLPPELVDKHIRFSGKNDFVFPEFYGSYWANVAQSLWTSSAKLEIRDGENMRDHLARQRVRVQIPRPRGDRTSWEWGTVHLDGPEPFSWHIRMVEKKFWGERFPVYARWKEDWWDGYLKRGYIDMKTGFRCSSVMGRNDCINYPVQGAAFHCLLQSAIDLNDWLLYNKLDTVIIGQIHDSLVLDVVPAELDDVLEAAVRTMGPELREKWPWIIVPMEVEADLAPVDRSWHEKKEIKLAA